MALKKITVFTLLCLLGIILAACGTGQKSTYEKIQEKKEMTFAMTGAYPPFNYIDDKGNLAGFDIDIANAIAEKMGVKAKPITTAWDGIISGLTGKRFDLIIGSMAITEKRKEQVNFSEPYYYDGAQFFAKADSGLVDIAQLKNGKVGVVTGTTFQEALTEMSNIKEIMQFESDVDNMKSVELGRIDGLVTAKLVGLYGAKKYGINLEPVGDFLYKETIGIAIRKEDTELLNAINHALEEIKADGTYAEISKKWFGRNILEN